MNAEFALHVDGTTYFLEVEPKRTHHPRFMPQFQFIRHRHPAYHLILVDGGGCTLSLTGLPPVDCPVRTLLLINPDFEHNFAICGSEGTIHNSLIWRLRDGRGNYLVRPLQALDGSDEKSARPYRTKLLTPVQSTGYLRQHREVEKFLGSSQQFVLSLKYFKLWMTGMELLLGDHWQQLAMPRDLSAGDLLVEQIWHLIEMNFYYRHFDLGYIASELGKNANYLNTVFSARESIGIGEAIRNRRLDHARELLTSSNDRIKDIYDQCGFVRQNYFTQAFRRVHGMTPLKYRKQFGGAR